MRAYPVCEAEIGPLLGRYAQMCEQVVKDLSSGDVLTLKSKQVET
jgi:hypothetical protein